jgi:ferredoxin
MSAEDQVYRDLQKRLDTLPIGYPPTTSGVEIRLLKHLFTPEEARVATQLSVLPESLRRIHGRVKRTGMSLGQLERMLDGMVSKGTVHRTTEDDKKLYQNMFLAVGMYELQLQRLTREFAADLDQYLGEAFGRELCRTGTTQLRTIPVEQSFPSTHYVNTYDDVRQIVERGDGRIVVNTCICRKGKGLQGQSCTQTALRETCFTFGDTADLVSRLGMGRAIGKDEALGILRRVDEDGLVLQPANYMEPGFICTCCGDCCVVLTTLKKLPRPADCWTTNHYAEVHDRMCSGCGMCVDRCQMDALVATDGKAEVNLDRCIGCGNCIAFCPDEAIVLCRRPQQTAPARNIRTLYENIMAEKVGRWNWLKVRARMGLGMRV